MPALAMLGAGVALLLFGWRAGLGALVQLPAVQILLLLDVAILVYRVWAIGDAYLVASGEHWNLATSLRATRTPAAAPLAVVLIATIVTHAAFGALAVQAQGAINCVFNPNGPCFFPGGGSVSPGASTPYLPAATMPAISGGNTNWRADGKLVLLLVGADASVGKWGLSPDAMILLEVDLATDRVAMYGIPRELQNVPLGPEAAGAYPCQCFPAPNPLAWLWYDAVRRPDAYRYPGSDFVRGFKAVEGAVGALTGLPVDGMVVIDLMGFVHLIDELFPSGVRVNVPTELRDKQYSEPQDRQDISIDIKPGVQQMDGLTLLAYARSRHQDSDEGRMVRQQAVLKAIRDQIQPCSLVQEIPSLLNTLGQTFWTDMSLGDAPALLGLAEHIRVGNIKGYELTPDVTGAVGEYLTPASTARIRSIVAHGLDGIPARVTGGGGGGDGLSC